VLRAYGHKNVSVLNGGLTKWVSEGRPTESIEEKEEDYNYELENEKVVTYEQIL
jgi:3-mercaptopyruvate sulfurtransferase SseA